MAATATAVLDVSILGASAADLALTTETLITLYVDDVSGAHEQRRVSLQYSPDNGSTWFDSPHSINGHEHFMTERVAATRVRACVCKAEVSAASVNVHILAR